MSHYHYPTPPGGWAHYPGDTPSSPHYYYAPPPYVPPHTNTPPRTKRHAHRASYSAAKDVPSWHAPPPSYGQNYQYNWDSPQQPRTYHSSRHDPAYEYYSTPRKPENVSAAHRGEKPRVSRTKPQRFSATDHIPTSSYRHFEPDFTPPTTPPPPPYDSHPSSNPFASTSHTRWRTYPTFMDDPYDSSDCADEFIDPSSNLPRGVPLDRRGDRLYGESRRSQSYNHTKPEFTSEKRHFSSHHHYHHQSSDRPKSKPATNQYYVHTQVPVYDETDAPKRSRARRASASAQQPRPTATGQSTSTSAKPPPKATEEDARRANIPAGYSIKNWNPNEAPIFLLGSAFDAHSLGKWIYDWTVYHHGSSAPMIDVAGDLWLMLMRLAYKVKRADQLVPHIRDVEAREMVEDFAESGERLWSRFKKLLKACEAYMWKAAKREGAGKGAYTMGRNSGCEFVDSIFGRDRELEETERLMHSIRVWDMRFDVNCGHILKHPKKAGAMPA
ncbi:hypothetical protein FQN57_002505 [Myotisia sp. PD_48]|nr:hypothetical protein FQN57_002505 [Myotisia sp. PD_48]